MKDYIVVVASIALGAAISLMAQVATRSVSEATLVERVSVLQTQQAQHADVLRQIVDIFNKANGTQAAAPQATAEAPTTKK